MEQQELTLPERRSRADQILAKFLDFHAANPTIWAYFQRYAFDVIQRGLTHYSAYAIFERIRWHLMVETIGSEVKLNNTYRPYYARMFLAKYPEHADLFETRRRTSEDYDAYDIDIEVFNTGPASGEAALMERLRKVA